MLAQLTVPLLVARRNSIQQLSLTMNNENAMSNFMTRLKQRDLLLGTMLSLPSAESAEIISHCGFDWLFLDGEHSPASVLDWQRAMQAVGERSACLLRVPTNSEGHIKKALDIGADGIIVPMINSAEQARNAVAWSQYPPNGRRGIGPGRASRYGRELANYIVRANEDIALVLQVEHIEAVENIDAIIDVEGVDAIFIGPSDLSASMGKIGQIDDAEVLAAMDKVLAACQRRKMPLGYFGMSASNVKPFIEKGYNLICAGTDADFITRGASQMAAELKP